MRCKVARVAAYPRDGGQKPEGAEKKEEYERGSGAAGAGRRKKRNTKSSCVVVFLTAFSFAPSGVSEVTFLKKACRVKKEGEFIYHHYA